MVFILAWMALGFPASILAKSKNRNVMVWSLVGLVFGPFAILAVALLKPLGGMES